MSPTTLFEQIIAASNVAAVSNPIVVKGQALVNFEVVNAAAQAVTAFVVQLQDHDNGEWYDYLGGADFATGSANMLFASTVTPPSTHANGGTSHASIRVNAAANVRFKVTLAGGAGNVTVRGSLARL